MNESEMTVDGRRRFLQALAAVGVASASAAAAPAAMADGSVEAAAGEKETKGYRETAHVRAYYRSARF